jgi:hypothetical protein
MYLRRTYYTLGNNTKLLGTLFRLQAGAFDQLTMDKVKVLAII